MWIVKLPSVKDWFPPIPDEWQSVPEINEDNTKLYRVPAAIWLLENEYENMTIVAEGVILVKSGDRVIGCATSIYNVGNMVVADLIIDYSTPERLELEDDNCSLWAKAKLEITSYLVQHDHEEKLTSVRIQHIEITKEKLNIPQIGKLII